MKKLRRITALLLAVVMIALMIPVATVSVSASQRDDIVNIALNQQGYHGRPNTFTNYFGFSGDWCAMFVTWCARQAGITEDVIPKSSSSTYNLIWFRDNGRYHSKNSSSWSFGERSDQSDVDWSYTPQKGDIMLLETNNKYYDGPDHTTLVTDCYNGTLYTVEGNVSGNKVATFSYSLDDSRIWGYCSPAYSNPNFPGEEDTSWDVPTWKNANCDLATYNDSGTQESNHYISAGDYCYIEKVYKNGFVRVNYPLDGGGDRWAYASASGFSLEKKIQIPSGSQTVSDGEYHIVSVLDESKGLDVTSASVDNGANIDLYPNSSDPNQVFEIYYLGDGSYKIINQHSGRSLDCADAGTSAGTNLQQWDYSNDPQKQWIIKETGDGESFYIVSKKSGLYIDVDNASTDNGTNIKLYTPNNSNAQKWKFITWGKNVGKTISEGEYHIASRLNSNMCLDVYAASKDNSANIDLYTNITSPEQVFVVSYLGDGYYKIINKNSGKSLDLQDAKCISTTNIQQYDYSDDGQKQWVIKPTSDGKAFNIISKKGGLCIDVQSGVASELQNIHGYISNGTLAQQWRFIAWQGDNATQTVSNGEYRIATAVNETKALDVHGAVFDDGANIQIYSNLNDQKQKFQLKYLNNGFYKISNSNSNKVLDVWGDTVTSNSNVVQHTSNGGANQEWMLKESDDGYYYIISHSNGLALDLLDAKDEDGANVAVHIQNQTTAQKWKLLRVLNPNMVEINEVVAEHGEIKPIISVSVENKELEENIDYTVSTYTKNEKTFVQVVGIGDFCDSVSVEYVKPTIEVGDTNLDNRIDIRDVTAIQRHIAEFAMFSDEQLAVADVDGNGVVTIDDATHLQRYLAEYDVQLG